MPVNLELKARVRDWPAVWAAAAALADGPPALLTQEDTFFPVPHGMLKLRRFSAEQGELISYRRENRLEARASVYSIVPTDRPGELCQALAEALGILGVVRKRRWLFLTGQTRIHLDEVDGLGQFLELEVVLRPGQAFTEGEPIVRDLQRRLGIRDEDLVAEKYIDLLTAATLPQVKAHAWFPRMVVVKCP